MMHDFKKSLEEIKAVKSAWPDEVTVMISHEAHDAIISALEIVERVQSMNVYHPHIYQDMFNRSQVYEFDHASMLYFDGNPKAALMARSAISDAMSASILVKKIRPENYGMASAEPEVK